MCYLPATGALQHNEHHYIELEDLQQALYQTFNLVQDYQVNIQLLDELPMKPRLEWPPFLKKKFRKVIKKHNNSFMPEPDHISWKHLKIVINNDRCILNIVNITNTYINLSHWSLYFKMSSSIIIPKPNKVSYDSSKMF